MILPGTPATSERGGTSKPSRDDGAGGDQATLADHRAAEQHRAHADQAPVADAHAVQHAAVADGDVGADHVGRAGVGVDHREVLDVGARADRERRVVAAHHAAEPDADVLAQRHVAGDDRVVRDEGAARDGAEQALRRELGHGGGPQVVAQTPRPRPAWRTGRPASARCAARARRTGADQALRAQHHAAEEQAQPEDRQEGAGAVQRGEDGGGRDHAAPVAEVLHEQRLQEAAEEELLEERQRRAPPAARRSGARRARARAGRRPTSWGWNSSRAGSSSQGQQQHQPEEAREHQHVGHDAGGAGATQAAAAEAEARQAVGVEAQRERADQARVTAQETSTCVTRPARSPSGRSSTRAPPTNDEDHDARRGCRPRRGRRARSPSARRCTLPLGEEQAHERERTAARARAPAATSTRPCSAMPISAPGTCPARAVPLRRRIHAR